MPHQNMAELSSWWAKAGVSVGGGPHGGGGNQIFLFLDLSFLFLICFSIICGT